MAAVAREYIDAALRACLPDGVPPSFRSINNARFVGVGRDRPAEADLTMFDGLPARVRVWLWGPSSYAHAWLDMPGGDCSFEAGRWIRIDHHTLEPIPDQIEMQLGDPA